MNCKKADCHPLPYTAARIGFCVNDLVCDAAQEHKGFENGLAVPEPTAAVLISQNRKVADAPNARGSPAITRLAVLPGNTVLLSPSAPPSG